MPAHHLRSRANLAGFFFGTRTAQQDEAEFARSTDEIISRGTSPYWKTVGWTPRPGMIGNIIGTLTHPSGESLFVMEFRHDDRTIFYFTERSGVEPIK